MLKAKTTSSDSISMAADSIIGAIQVLRNRVRGGSSDFTEITATNVYGSMLLVLQGVGCVSNFLKKRYVTLVWPPLYYCNGEEVTIKCRLTHERHSNLKQTFLCVFSQPSMSCCPRSLLPQTPERRERNTRTCCYAPSYVSVTTCTCRLYANSGSVRSLSTCRRPHRRPSRHGSWRYDLVSENVGQSADVKCDCNFYRALDCVLWVHVNLQNLEFNAGKLKSVDFDP